MARMSNLAAIAGLDAITGLLNSGTLEIFDGTIPTTTEEADAGTLLAVHALDATAFGGAVDGSDRATADAAHIGDELTALDTGTAQYYRMKDSGTAVVYQGDCGTSNAELIFNTVSFVAGGLVTITDFAKLHLSEGTNP